MKKIIAMVFGVIVAQLAGHAIWILALVNLLWMLVKDAQLFSWWWVAYAAITFVVALLVSIGAVFFLED
jgi:hypothetical protein